MKSLEKRLSQIEAKMKPKEEKPAAHVAMIRESGKVTVHRPNSEGSFQLPNEDALQTWIKDNNLDEGLPVLKVIIANSQNAGGVPPKEL